MQISHGMFALSAGDAYLCRAGAGPGRVARCPSRPQRHDMARYKMQEMPDLNQTGERRSYPRLILDGQTTTDELAGAIAAATTFGAGEVKGLLGALAERLAVEMRRGKSVKLDGIGTFTAALGLREGFEAETPGAAARRNARSICVKGVSFRPDKALVSATGRGLSLERVGGRAAASSDRYTPAERAAMALAFLDERPVLRVADYCRLTGLRPTRAREELRRLAADPQSGLAADGKGSHRVYVKRPAENNGGGRP